MAEVQQGMTDGELQEIEARCNAATPGPWVAVMNPLTDDDYCVTVVDGRVLLDTYVSISDADAAFIATARADVPALIAEVRRLRGQLAHVAVNAALSEMACEELAAAVEDDSGAWGDDL